MSRPSQDWRGWRVAITGMNAKPENPGPGAAVARCLREAPGYRGRLVGLGYEALDAGLYQRQRIDSGYLLPYPSSGAAVLLDRLDEILAEEPLDAILPCLDAELPNFIHVQAELAQRGVRLLLPDREQLQARDKDRLPALGEAAQVTTPRVRQLTDPRFFDALDEADGWRWPLVVKGVFYDAYVVHGPEEARLRFGQLAAQWGYPVLVQPFVAGEEVNLCALGDGQGGLVGAVMMRKLALTEKGKAWSGVVIDDPELLAAAGRLMAALRWRGPFELEMLRGRDGVLHLVEINPRFPAWVYLSHGAGRNLPAALLELLAGSAAGSLVFPPPRPGVSFIRYAEEVIVDMGEIMRLSASGALTHATTRQAGTTTHH